MLRMHGDVIVSVLPCNTRIAKTTLMVRHGIMITVLQACHLVAKTVLLSLFYEVIVALLRQGSFVVATELNGTIAIRGNVISIACLYSIEGVFSADLIHIDFVAVGNCIPAHDGQNTCD